ncbi:DUF4937 domain-containing protein [Rugosimonospora acidiphila]
MLIKWVPCEVTDAAGFDRRQGAWRSLVDQPGFLAQFGG